MLGKEIKVIATRPVEDFISIGDELILQSDLYDENLMVRKACWRSSVVKSDTRYYLTDEEASHRPTLIKVAEPVYNNIKGTVKKFLITHVATGLVYDYNTLYYGLNINDCMKKVD